MNERCALCGHTPACGYATVTEIHHATIRLCHADDHSCYQRWTIYGERPTPKWFDHEPTEEEWRGAVQAS